MPASRKTGHDLATTGLSVEELAALSGVPVRTIREYQTWQVLPPPTRVGRRGFYDDTHVRRLASIGRLQQRGYSIASMRDLFDAWAQGSGLHEVLGIDDPLAGPADEAPVLLTRSQLAELLPAVAASPRLLARAVRTGLLSADGDRYTARSPALLQLVAEAVEAGLSPTAALDLAGAVVAAAAQAGAAAAEALARALDGGPTPEVEALARRARVLLARAVATHTIDQAGQHLRRQDTGDAAALADFVERIRIGTTHRPPA